VDGHAAILIPVIGANQRQFACSFQYLTLRR
jgi:hypothetical protein